MIRFGAFDVLFPAGVVSISNEQNIFGLRLLTLVKHTGDIINGRNLDWKKIRTGSIIGQQLYEFEWEMDGKKAKLSWSRIDEKRIYGRVCMDDGLEIIAEAYVPWKSRLKQRWVNFVLQDARTITGEMITPYVQPSINAVRIRFDGNQKSALAYNDREKQIKNIMSTGELGSITSGRIWDDMGLSWQVAVQFDSDFSFIMEVGDAEDFLILPRDENMTVDFQSAREAYLAIRKVSLNSCLKTGGLLGDTAKGMHSLVGLNTIYREETGRRYIIVDRPWTRGEDDWGIIFNWDTFLGSLIAAWFDADLSKENILSGFDTQLPDGRIPLHTRALNGQASEPPILAGRCQHIVHGFTIWKSYLHHRDREWLATCYPMLVKIHRWWFDDRGDGQSWRDGTGKGLLTFGYDPVLEMGKIGASYQPYVAKAQYAYFETYDDSPMWTDGEFFKSIKGKKNLSEKDVTDEAKYLENTCTANMYTLERNCLFALESECLSKIAKVLGYMAESEAFLKEYEDMKTRINETMWDETEGCYFNVKYNGEFSRIYSPDCFIPMTAGIASRAQSEKLIKLLLDPDKFWGKHVIPSISRDHPSFKDQAYWRGQIWPPQTYWTYLGLKKYGFDAVAAEFSDKVRGMYLREWEENGFSCENFNALTGRCSGSPHYTWGNLMGVIALEEYVSIDLDHVTFGRNISSDDLFIRNIAIGVDIFDIEIKDDITIVYKGGKEIARGKGPIKVAL